MTQHTNTASGAADLPEALPEALTVAVDCWFAKNTGLGGCSDKDVRELADIFRLHALAAGQATAEQGVAYAAPSESFLEIPDVQDESGINAYYSREVVLECIDAARASHGQAPAGATEMENLQRTAVGWQERALRAERNWVVCRRWAIAGGAPVEKLGDSPDPPFHAALAAGQATAAQPAAQQGVAYAALPEPYCNAHDDGDAYYPDMFSEHQMHAFADATCALRASHVQAPAETGNSVSAQADSVQEDAALWHWLAEYLVGPRTDLDDEIVASETVNDLRKLVKAAIKQGATQ